MCLYSTEVDKEDRVNAKAGDTLTKEVVFGGHHAFMKGSKVACIKHGTKVELTLQLHPQHTPRAFAKEVTQPLGTKPILGKQLWKHDGKTVEATLIQWHGDGKGDWAKYTTDGLQLADGTCVHLAWLMDGSTVTLPKAVRKPRATKRNLSDILGLDQLRAEVPLKAGTRKSAKAS